MPKITLSFYWPLRAETTRDLLFFAFHIALVTYLGFYILERIAPGFVTLFFDLEIFFWTSVVIGALAILWQPAHRERKVRPSHQLAWAIFTALVGMGVIWLQTKSIGSWATVIAGAGGLVLFGLTWQSFSSSGKPTGE